MMGLENENSDFQRIGRGDWNTSFYQAGSGGIEAGKNVMQSSSILGNQRLKDVTVKTLAQLKAKLYVNAAHAMKQNPAKAEIIQKAVDRDASHLAFAMNMVLLKM